MNIDKFRSEFAILVVDDEPNIRAALARILSLEGYPAEQAASGEEALQQLTHKMYDLMILDMQMPGLTGLEVMQKVQVDYPQLLIIILTGNATIESAIAAAKLDSVVDYLRKPIKTDEFVQVIASALKKSLQKRQQSKLLNAAAQMIDFISQDDDATVPIKPITTSAKPTLPVPQNEDTLTIHVHPLNLDYMNRLVIVDGQSDYPHELTEGEADLLALFMKSPDRVFSCRELVQLAFGYASNEYEAEQLVRPYISRLRRKVESNPRKPRLIRTVRRRGYLFPSPNNRLQDG